MDKKLRNIKTPKMKRRTALKLIKKELTTAGQVIDFNPIDKGMRKLKREIRRVLNFMKEKKKLEKFQIITTIAETALLAEIHLFFPNIKDVCVMELTITKK